MSAVTASTVTVPVTQEHINQGEKNDCSGCPIALAFDAAIPEALDVTVTTSHASVWLDTRRVVDYELPDDARDFIQAFDNGVPVEPFTFEAQEVTP